MNRFSDKIKIIYLSLVILFSLGVFVYLLDTWGIIRLEEFMPLLSRTPPVVAQDQDSPTELELERINKEREKLEDRERELKELESSLKEQKAELEMKLQEIEELKKGVAEEKSRIAEEKQAQAERSVMIQNMAGRLGAMPPDDAVSIARGWSNTDLVDVFLQMERDAEEAGRPSIVPFLLTKLPRERASIITTLMMDEEARRLPK